MRIHDPVSLIRRAACLGIFLSLSLAAIAQSEPLGPHNLGSLGCFACHPPATVALDADALADRLWMRDSALPRLSPVSTDIVPANPLFHSFVCLTCHDGSIASLQMIGGPPRLRPGTLHPLFDIARADGRHPVHVPYRPNDGCIFSSENCDPAHWPSRVDANGVLTWDAPGVPETLSASYGHPTRFYPTPDDGGQAMVECSSCHNPHSLGTARQMLESSVQEKPSKAFLRGWYETEGKYSDTVSKFCRSCHYDKAGASAQIKE